MNLWNIVIGSILTASLLVQYLLSRVVVLFIIEYKNTVFILFSHVMCLVLWAFNAWGTRYVFNQSVTHRGAQGTHVFGALGDTDLV
jgi:hypothetical protein